MRVLMLFLMVVLPSQVFAGDLYTGVWGGINKTSIEFISKDPLRVRYCWKTQCGLHAPLGDEHDMVFEWSKTDDFPGAVMTMKKVGEHYFATHKMANETLFSEAMLRKR